MDRAFPIYTPRKDCLDVNKKKLDARSESGVGLFKGTTIQIGFLLLNCTP